MLMQRGVIRKETGYFFLLAVNLKESLERDTANSVCIERTPYKKQNQMKKLLALITVIAVSSSPVFAGCGKTVTNEGTLKSFDAATKTLVVAGKDGKEAKITLTPTTKGADAVAGMVGKSVKVDHEHNKATSVAAGS